jgi:hypothetical protein
MRREYLRADSIGIAEHRDLLPVRGYGLAMTDWRLDRARMAAVVSTLIDLWDKRAGLGWEVTVERHGVNVAMINAYVSHAVNLSRALLKLHSEGLTFESVGLVRTSMECSVTASWLALYPEKTPDLLKFSAVERKKLLTEIVTFGGATATESIAQVEKVEAIEGHTDPEGRWLKSRFLALQGGDGLYVTYRALCALDHAGNSLADAYTETATQSEANPWGIVMRDRPKDPLAVSWLGIQACSVLQAQIAADMVLTKPRHKTQLSSWAKKLGVPATVEPSGLSQPAQGEDSTTK